MDIVVEQDYNGMYNAYDKDTYDGAEDAEQQAWGFGLTADLALLDLGMEILELKMRD